VHFTRKEIREQLTDLGAFRQEVLDEHDAEIRGACQRLDQVRQELEDLGVEQRRQMGHLDRAAAQWSARAVSAGMSEAEVLELLGVQERTFRIDR
jgi:hypothetical protein